MGQWRTEFTSRLKCSALLCFLPAAMTILVSAPAFSQALGPLFGIDKEVEARPERIKLLPDDFFASFPTSKPENIAVEADNLIFDADANQITAQGNVKLSYNGYFASADRAVYDRSSGDLVLVGNAVVRDPENVVYTGTRIEVKGDFKRAFVRALEMQTPNGALITANEADYRNNIETILNNGTYAPCGICVDDEGRKIGWRIKASTIILNKEKQTLYMELPQLELLGQPIAMLPFLWMPDPTNPRAQGFRFPRSDYSDKFGTRVAVPYFYPVGASTDLWLTPMAMSRQGFLLDAELAQNFATGTARVRAAGTYQLDRTAFAGEVGDRDWRGAIQVSGSFVPAENWNMGWSYLAFSDPAFIPDYKLVGFDSINDIYAQYLDDKTFFDARVQEFVVLGNVLPASQQQQGKTLPQIQLNLIEDLPDQMGQIEINGNLLGVSREADQTSVLGGVPYIYGYEGNKVRATLEAIWSRQMVAPGGLLITPYLGARIDAASYDGASPLIGASSLFSATPIAALDIRFPLMAIDNKNSYIFEPIAQLVYRGGNATMPGINNDNAQGFIFEDTNLFSFNRFSGADRQETGLRANIGGQFLANFEDGSWLRLIGGQSYFLAGINSFSLIDTAQVGNLSGLENTSSFIVAGAQAGLGNGVEVGAKMEFDPASRSIVRAAVATEVNVSSFTLSADYFYLAAKPARGILADTQAISATIEVPVADYWRITTGARWDLVAGTWADASVGAEYDDSFLSYGAKYSAIQNVSTLAVDHNFSVNFSLKGPSN